MLSMINKALIIFTLLLFSSVNYAADEKRILGRVEAVTIADTGVTLPAKVDTGAFYPSLHAQNIRIFEKEEEEEWVSFTIPASDYNKSVTLERKLHRHHRIISRADNDEEPDEPLFYERPVVLLDLCVADLCAEVEVNLTDRSNFTYPVLLAREALYEYNVLIEPKEQYIYTKKPAILSEDSGIE